MQQEWGLPCTVTPRFTARLVQERHNLHYLADRAAITGKFSSPDLLHIDQAFPVLMKQLELKLADGELSPCQQRTVTLYAKGLPVKPIRWVAVVTSISLFIPLNAEF